MGAMLLSSRFALFPSQFAAPCGLNHHRRSITCCNAAQPEEKKKSVALKGSIPGLSKVATTVTILSLSLPQASAASEAMVAEKKRTKSSKKEKVMTPEERRAWAEGLPVVLDKIPFSDILELKTQGKLKYVIKHPKSKPKATPDVVFVVLEDNRVLRTVLPPSANEAFWSQWDNLRIGDLVMNAYSPPIPKPEMPKKSILASLISGLAQRFTFPSEEEKPKQEEVKKPEKPEKLEKLEKLEEKINPEIMDILQTKKEVEQQRKELEEEREAIKEMRAELKRQKALEAQAEKQRRKMERQERMLEEGKIQEKQVQIPVKREPEISSSYWDAFLEDELSVLFLAFLIFVLFYRTVVLSYRKRRKDYEDRLKIQQLEDEEKATAKELDREMDAALETREKGRGTELNKLSKDNPFLEASLQFLSSGAKHRKAGFTTRYLDRSVDVRFSDVAGLGSIRKELEEIVEFFKYPERYRGRGAAIPSGILLCGEPGVGKTLLAKAVAGEAGASFLSIPASQFVEMFAGVGASRVRALYDEAKANAPAVVFIDEIDAVGRKRGLVETSGGKERDNTVNQLLVCLDGFEGKGEVITIAATNRPDVLDPALVRPGRFDRRIYIPLPGLAARIDILKKHMSNKPVGEDIDYATVASAAGYVSGADLASLVNSAALAVIRKGRTEITTKDLLAQVQGDEDISEDEFSTQMQMKLAINEAAVSVVASNFPDFRNIEMLSIARMLQSGIGCLQVTLEETKFEVPCNYSRQTILDYITIQLSSRAADEMWNGSDKLCTISAEMVDNARSAARWLVYAGLSDKQALYGICDCWHEAHHLSEVDTEALRILNACYGHAKEILQRNRGLVDLLIRELLEKKTLRKAEFLQLVSKYGNFDPFPQQPVEIRNYYIAKSQNTAVAGKC
eukprot:TRINITY_DN35287_c0_g1_i1.p1 TRINITY_DN35287_c0_g1~~TRINITY_DN35287_c0_g1_i1.p1  ORF type:complete len:906 (-),score=206.51 TRINITY_DN35287_c0_g1_i1:214-2931(-)